MPDSLATPLAGAVLPIIGDSLVVRRGGRLLVDHASLTMDNAGLTVLMGPNGAGKSLLLRLLAGLVTPDSGTVTWAGSSPERSRASRVGLVFQRPVMLRRSALANIRFALKAAGVPRAERMKQAMDALDSGGLSHLAESPARVLSGGEQQRLALVRALAPRPSMLLLDEPTANLDPASTLAIETVMQEAADQGTRLLLVTHDPGQARRLGDRIAFMCAGHIEAPVPVSDFFDHPATGEARAFIEGRLVL